MNIKIALTVSAIAVIGVGAAPPATADPMPPNCVNDPIGIFKAKQRLICDTPLRPDGSWSRERVFWIPAHQVPFTSYSSSCSGGYFVDLSVESDETYVVTPDTVLGDEPGHLD